MANARRAAAGVTTGRPASLLLRLLDLIPPRLEEYDILMTGQPIWRERLQGVGVITSTEAIALGATGPILRSTGVAWDLRRSMPYLHYDEDTDSDEELADSDEELGADV